MTQLGELRDAFPKFVEAGVKLYAISYDDREILAEFAATHDIPYPLLSDVDSAVIRRYGILNEQAGSGGPLAGIPYPGTYVTDEDGVVVEKFFHDSYKMREGGEVILDSALGRVLLGTDEPSAVRDDRDGVRVSATLHGGPVKQGAQRRVVVRFELADGLHIYGEPVAEGMIPTTVTVEGPEGLHVGDPILPPTETLRLPGLDVELFVWSGRVDIQVPVYALSSLASECRPLDRDRVTIEVGVRYQACDDHACRMPQTEKLTLEVPLQAIDVPAIALHMGHGQREAKFDGTPHMRRLVLRKLRESPLGFARFVLDNLRWELLALPRKWRRKLG